MDCFLPEVTACLTAILLVQVATESGEVAVTVLEALSMARARGGAYRVLCQTGPRAGQQSVLKHGGRPSELAQLRQSGIDTASWHQVCCLLCPKSICRECCDALCCGSAHLQPIWCARG